MSGLKASKEQKSNFKRPDPLEPGSYPARLVRVIDLGLQTQQPYQGKPKPPAHMISVTYEFSDEFMKDENGNDLEDKPRWLSEDFVLNSLAADLATSTKRYKVLDPDMEFDGDWTQCLGRPVMVTVAHNVSKKNGQVYEKVALTSVMRKKDADKLPELKNPTKFFDLNDPDLEFFNSLPKFMQEKISGNLEFEGSKLQGLLEGGALPEKKAEKPKKEAPAEAEQEDDIPW